MLECWKIREKEDGCRRICDDYPFITVRYTNITVYDIQYYEDLVIYSVIYYLVIFRLVRVTNGTSSFC